MEPVEPPPPTLDYLFSQFTPNSLIGVNYDPAKWHVLHIIAGTEPVVLKQALNNAVIEAGPVRAAAAPPPISLPKRSRGREVVNRKPQDRKSERYQQERWQILAQEAEIATSP